MHPITVFFFESFVNFISAKICRVDQSITGRIYLRYKNIINASIYGENGRLAGAMLVALLALALEFGLAALQRRLTSKGLQLSPA